jgi:hypothetical protein
MKKQLLSIYPKVQADHVFITGTPQFDFHFKKEFMLSREEVCRKIGIDPKRPFILYTTGIMNHFYEEHRLVEEVIRFLRDIDIKPKPQLVVRTYVKGTSPEMKALANQDFPGVVFRPGLWEEKWQTPLYEDLALYTNLLRYTSLGINAASTVSLELMMFDKPVVNLDFDPPGSNLPWCMGYSRHIQFDHYKLVAESGAVMVARSMDDLRNMIARALSDAQADSNKQHQFLQEMFNGTLDGNSGKRVAECLIRLALNSKGNN